MEYSATFVDCIHGMQAETSIGLMVLNDAITNRLERERRLNALKQRIEKRLYGKARKNGKS